MVSAGARYGGNALAKTLKMLIAKSRTAGVTGVATSVSRMNPTGLLTGVFAYDILKSIFDRDRGEYGTTDEQTADGLIKSTMAIVSGAEEGGIPLDGLKGRNGDPLPTNYIVIDIEKERIFPISKYRSAKSIRSARRRGSFRGYGRAMRSTARRKYIYK